MNGLIDAIVKLLRNLFGGGTQQPGESTQGMDGAYPPDHELPAIGSQVEIPEVTTSEETSDVPGEVATPEFSAQAAACIITVRPELGTVNLRLGPGLGFEPPIAKTRGSARFALVGASSRGADGLRWYNIRLGSRSAWIRSDLVNVPRDCLSLSFINEEDITPEAPPPPPDERFPPPTNAVISQGYHLPAHPGLDMAVDTGRALIAPTAGVCIRRVECTKCTEERPNRRPNPNFQCPDTWSDPAWGFGYGNFIIVRYDYNRLPPPLREEMDKRNLRGGFAYVLFAHLSRLNVRVGEQFQKGTALAATGNTGCSTGPHLHFEVRIGNDETVDGRWSLQRPVNPKFMYDVTDSSR